MATREDTVQYIRDQAGLGRRLESRKMFGEYALYLDGKVIALVCDDQLFLKPTPQGRQFLGTVAEGAPYPGAKPHFLIAEELEDPERLAQALEITASALPAPRPKAAKRKPSGTKPAKRKAAKKRLSSRHR
jgi:TfoX/Sxy family transcriptional regulator of competence genes